ncbi:MAG: Tar ligand binding domain-containing protein [Candidatus Nitrotoga sp.]
MKIRTLLITIIASLATLLLGGGATALFGMDRMEDSLKTVYEDRIVALSQLSHIEALMLESHLTMSNTLPSPTPTTDMISTNIARIEKNIAQIDKLWAAYLTTFLTPEEKILAAKFDNNRKKLIDQGFIPSIAALRAHDFEKARQIAKEINRQTYAVVAADISNLSELQLTVAKEAYLDAQRYYKKFKDTGLAVSIIGLIFASWLGFLLIRSISVPIEKVLRFTQALVAGDLAPKLELKSNNEIGKLTQAVNQIHDHLVHALAEAHDNQLRIKAILDNVDEGIILIGHDSRIEVFNPAAGNIFDYTQREMVGKDINVLLLGEDVCRPSAPPEQHLELTDDTASAKRREFVGVRKDCSHFPLELRTRTFHFGHESLVLVMARDLTTDKQAAAVQALLVEKEALLKEVHHRVKNNLQIIGNVEFGRPE